MICTWIQANRDNIWKDFQARHNMATDRLLVYSVLGTCTTDIVSLFVFRAEGVYFCDVTVSLGEFELPWRALLAVKLETSMVS